MDPRINSGGSDTVSDLPAQKERARWLNPTAFGVFPAHMTEHISTGIFFPRNDALPGCLREGEKIHQ